MKTSDTSLPEFRPDTLDAELWDSVYRQNEYGIPDRIDGMVVIDIGAHIRSPASVWIAARRMCTRTKRMMRTRRCAREISPATAARFLSAGWWTSESGPVQAIAFDDIVAGVRKRQVSKVRLLAKLDCEGSEYPILLTSRRLAEVDWFVGEYHPFYPQIEGLPPFTEASLAAVFRKAGKAARFRLAESGLGTFDAGGPAVWSMSDFDKIMAEEWSADGNGVDLGTVGRLATFTTPLPTDGDWSGNDVMRARLAVLGKRMLVALDRRDRLAASPDATVTDLVAGMMDLKDEFDAVSTELKKLREAT